MALHVCITSVINGSAHRRRSGTKAQQKEEAHVIIYMPISAPALWRLKGAITDTIVKGADMLNAIVRHTPTRLSGSRVRSQ